MNLTKQYQQILRRDAKILNICHFDLDGVGSSIVVKNVFKNVSFIDLKYGQVDIFLKNLDFSEYDVVLMTDISPETEEVFNLSDKLFLLDHHDSAVRFNNPEKNRIVIAGKSACLLCKNFFENLFNLDLSYLDELCKYINDFDMWELKFFEKSWSFNCLYYYYFSNDFRKRFGNGDVKFNDIEIKYILEQRKLLEKTYKSITFYELESIKSGFYIGGNFINDICHRLMIDKNLDLVFCINPKSNSCSVRSKNENIHIGHILQELFPGAGGHKASAAFHLKEYDDIQESIEKVERYLFKNFPEIRR